jgi:hypothetical protein
VREAVTLPPPCPQGTSAGFLNTADGAQNDDGYAVPTAVTPTAISAQFKVSGWTSGSYSVTLELWVNGAMPRVDLPKGATVAVNVRASIEDCKVTRVRTRIMFYVIA